MSVDDPMGVESWRALGIECDVSKATVSVSAVKDDVHTTPYRPTVDGVTDEMVYLDIPSVLVTAHDCVRIHDFVRELRRASSIADQRPIENPVFVDGVGMTAREAAAIVEARRMAGEGMWPDVD